MDGKIQQVKKMFNLIDTNITQQLETGTWILHMALIGDKKYW